MFTNKINARYKQNIHNMNYEYYIISTNLKSL